MLLCTDGDRHVFRNEQVGTVCSDEVESAKWFIRSVLIAIDGGGEELRSVIVISGTRQQRQPTDLLTPWS
jgi:hypothetical protein